MKSNFVTAIVPAFNEEKTIGAVLLALKKSKFINQILVVDDGSEDNTRLIARDVGVTVISNKRNLGKSESVKTALKFVKNRFVFLCDSDLINFTSEICDSIIYPVLSDKYSMSIGLRNYGKIWNRLSEHIPSISGERALAKSVLLECSKSKYFTGYGLELTIHYYCKFKKLPTHQKAYGYNQLFNTSKRNVISGIVGYVGEWLLLLKITIMMKTYYWH